MQSVCVTAIDVVDLGTGLLVPTYQSLNKWTRRDFGRWETGKIRGEKGHPGLSCQELQEDF